MREETPRATGAGLVAHSFNSSVVTEVGYSHGLGQSVPALHSPVLGGRHACSTAASSELKGAALWFLFVVLPMDLAVHSGHLSLPLFAICVVPFCVPVGER